MMNTFLAINWSAIGLQAAQLILSLSILVIMHELGHFIPAKIFKCRVEKFYLFFDPYFSLFKKKIGETVYGIGWLPLGGYVKISGMVDESMDKEHLNAEPQPWEFRSKPAWQRLIIMIGGVSVNIILAFFIYAMVLFTWGETKLPMKNMNGGIWAVDSISTAIGIKTGDKIISVNKKVVTYFDDLNPEILMGKEILLQRNGVDTTVYVPESFIGQVVEQKKRTPIVLPRIPAFVGEVADSSAAQNAGLIAKDQIVEIDSIPVTYFDQIKPILQSRKNQQIAIKVKRDGQIIALSTLISGEGQIGFFPMIPSNDDLEKMNFYNFEVKKFTLIESFPAGFHKATDKLSSYIQQFKMILNPATGAYKGLGGFKSMGSIFPNTGWDWEIFWNITAFLSIALAFMNLLPIPALDGGHVVFTIYEMITGRKPGDKFLEYAQIVGMILLFGLVFYANLNDWLGWGRSK